MFDMSHVLKIAECAARQAGAAIVDDWNAHRSDVREKRTAEVVSCADMASDGIISAAIRAAFPSHRILSEEGNTADGYDATGPLWIVDPIDGSANYVRGHPYFAVSIAFADNGIVQAGCVHAPALRETFLASKGAGAALNGNRIKVSSPRDLKHSVVSTGFPHEKTNIDHLLGRVNCLLRHCHDVRRSASPVLDISYVGMGRLDAHTESLFAWDIAAAGLIAAEAGAKRSHLVAVPDGIPRDLFGEEVVFSAPEIHDELVERLSKSFGIKG